MGRRRSIRENDIGLRLVSGGAGEEAEVVPEARYGAGEDWSVGSDRIVFRWIACGVEDTPDGPRAIGYRALNPDTPDGVVDLEPHPSTWDAPPRNSRGEVVLGHLADYCPEGWVPPDA